MKKTVKIKKANTLVFALLRPFFALVLYLVYRFRFETETSWKIKRPCLILSNHQTVIDQFALGMGFAFGINFVAGESIFRHGILSRLMSALVRPIPFSKGNSDFLAVKTMMSVIKRGGAVGMFPSGNRSFFGGECTIPRGIGKLAKLVNAPLVLVNIRGGFNTKARWSAAVNRGKMRASVTRVVSVEELAAMSAEEVNGIIQKELDFDESSYNEKAGIVFRGKRRAEYLESALFYCPECDNMESLRSEGNEFFCLNCGARVRINGRGFLEKTGEKAARIPGTIREWGRAQLEYVKAFDFSPFTEKPVFSDAGAVLSRAERAKSEEILGTGTIELYADRLRVCGRDFLFTETTLAIVGVKKLTIYGERDRESLFSVKVPARTNLVKYMICAYHLRNKALNIKEEFYGY